MKNGKERCYANGGLVLPDMGTVPVPGEKPAFVPPAAAAPAPSPIPAILAQAQQAGGQMVGQYTPEMRNQLYAAMLQRANSTPNGIASALSSVGDAISRGYGRTNTNFLDKSQALQQEGVKSGLDAFDTSGKMNAQQIQSGMELGKMDPNSQISKLHQDAYRDALKSLGFTDDQIGKMPASNIETVANVGLKRADIESQNELKKATIQLQTLLGVAGIQGNAAKSLADRGLLKKVADFISKSPETQKLESQMNMTTPAGAPVAAPPAAGPYGPSVTQGGHTYTWNAETKKYE